MLTFKAEVLKSQRKVDGTYNVKIRMTYNREVKRLSTNIFVRQEDLTRSFKLKNPLFVKEADKLVRQYQEICAHLPLEATTTYTANDILEYIKIELGKKKEVDFILFSREWLPRSTAKGRKNYQSALNAFIDYLGKDNLPINCLTQKLLRGFIDYLLLKRQKRIAVLEKQGKRIPSNRSVSLYLGCIRHLFNEAKKCYNDYDKNVILISHAPFEYLELPKQEATRKRAIPADLVRKIWELPYILTATGKERQCPYNLAKDCFILSFCLMGMNSADLYNCVEFTDGVITYYRTKTKDRRQDKAKMQVAVPPMMLPVVQKYRDFRKQKVFNFHHHYSTAGNFNHAINKGLKQIGKLLHIDDLEYYAARHSWATIAVNKVGIDKYTVHAALNHIDESMKVTDIYIERDFAIENEANRKVLEYVFGEVSKRNGNY